MRIFGCLPEKTSCVYTAGNMFNGIDISVEEVVLLLMPATPIELSAVVSTASRLTNGNVPCLSDGQS